MIDAKIGHSALTWDVLSDPPRLSEAIVDCAEIGFQGTETGGFVYDWWEQERPGQLKRELDARGIVMGCLFEFGDWIDPNAVTGLLESGRRWATGVQALGGNVVMLVPGNRRETPPYGLDDFQLMAETMNRVGEVVRAEGAISAVHPHWGTMAESRLEIDAMLHFMDPALVGFAPDTGQIAKGGADPMAAIARWVDRVQHVHMKDLSSHWAELQAAGVPLRSPEGYCEMGQGVIDFTPLLPMLDSINYTGWLMAELDEATRPPREAAQLSWDYIKRAMAPYLAAHKP
jgi:inosose dehydratase